jgi:hypothetical protein
MREMNGKEIEEVVVVDAKCMLVSGSTPIMI